MPPCGSQRSPPSAAGGTRGPHPDKEAGTTGDTRRDPRPDGVLLVHTAHLDGASRQAARDLPDLVFEGGMTGDDREHALGGRHAPAWEDGELTGHASLVRRRRRTAAGRCAPGTSRAWVYARTGRAAVTARP
ncbi:hypothetical protein [Streptomyces sp. F63]|uniref:hypothetical protein n=1 Tax=Streptomyces sp. F63 TaxID=2824887 RepID=UPI0027DE1055|nr:hypothetical protein [Streptomyces sp. F63]